MKITDKNANEKSILKKVLNDGTLLETVFEEERRVTHLFVSHDGDIRLADHYSDPRSGIVYLPLREEAVLEGRVTLPKCASVEEILGNHISYSSLSQEIRAFILRYADMDQINLSICQHFVINTWLFDKYEKTPYLRILGFPGTGKSRIKKVLGSISYHTLDIGVGMTEAAIFRSIEKYKPGVLLIDEANLQDSSLFSSIVKILNGGYEQGSAVSRCRPNDYEPEFFDVFCPKIIANHTYFDDSALESRMLTIITCPTRRSDIPDSLSGTNFFKEANVLQRKLLAFRLFNFQKIDSQKTITGLDRYTPRLQEIILPLLRTAGYDEAPEEIISFLDMQQTHTQEHAEKNPEVLIALALREYLRNGVIKAPIKDITDDVNIRSEEQFSTRRIGQTLKIMGIPKKRLGSGWLTNLSSIDIDDLSNRYSLPN